MNALLRLKLLRKPATPHPYLAPRDVTVTSALHDVRGLREADLLMWVRRNWWIAGCLKELAE